ncbi:ferredoxin [Maliponia aquimaris]|uniref:Epoxyqueuosine reductase n=1 Tax=Maliponia aquimaris TaxID=1673631 RepID=A0A238K9Q9_9RHOB|nr:ferredoxin [Maliponia aquimaris]SMX39124.1 Epoxyqueuosine reductase [Maliponia aquimaris]
MTAGRLAQIDDTAHAAGLRVRGALHPGPDDGAPEGTGTLLLLGPDEPCFWPVFTAAPEYRYGAPDPLDRWSKRVIGALATEWGGTAIFPSDGPPYAPFLTWALASGRAWSSPVGMLVQDAAGLFISYRGAVALPARLDLPPPAAKPCDACPRPCETACPVGALAPGQMYDVARCKAHLRRPEGMECRHGGCLVRRACPVAKDFERLPQQSAFHMAAFLGDPVP